MNTTRTIEFAGIKFSNENIVESNDFWDNILNYEAKAYLIAAMYSDPIIIWGKNEQEALDNVVDESTKFDYLQIENPSEKDYEENTCLGNASELFDLDLVRIFELPKISLDFVLLFQDQNPCK